MKLKNKNILLGVTGGIAAYKSAELCRLFVKEGASVQVVMTRAACEFITPLTMATLSGRPVHVEMFDNDRSGQISHIEDGTEADVLVIAPCTADFLARAASGRAEDLLSAVTLAFTKQIVAAPAMNTNMWKNPAVQRNLALLCNEHSWHIVSPQTGQLACGTIGEGRMAEPADILSAVTACFQSDFENKKFLVTAGPTVEDIDPVRFLSNRSSGKMGYSIAEAAAQRGAEVTLISGPVALPCPKGVTIIPVRSAVSMQQQTEKLADFADVIVMAAAVADFRPQNTYLDKIKKADKETTNCIELVPNPDILKGLGERFKGSSHPILVGFALETQNLKQSALDKLAQKGASMIVANLASDGFEGDDNKVIVFENNGRETSIGPISKKVLSHRLLDIIAEHLK